MIRSLALISICFLVFSCSDKGDIHKPTILGLKLYSSKEDFYNQLNKLAEDKKLNKIENKNGINIYYLEYQDTVKPSYGFDKEVLPVGNLYSYYGVIAPVITEGFVEQIRVYFLPEIYNDIPSFYETFYTQKNTPYFWANWHSQKDPYHAIINSLNSKYGKWANLNSECNTDMTRSNMPYKLSCATYKWLQNGVQMKFMQSSETVTFTSSLHIEYSLDSITTERNKKTIETLLGKKDKI